MVRSGKERSLWAVLLLGAAFLMVSPAAAKAEMTSAPSPLSASPPTSTTAQNGKNAAGPHGRIEVPCTCRYRGYDYQQGETVCIRGRIARCDMVLNNTSWAMTDEICPAISQGPPGMSHIPASQPLLAAIIPFQY